MTAHTCRHFNPDCYRCDLNLDELSPEPGRWWCPDCDRVLRKPPLKYGERRYHSAACHIPMQPVTVQRT